MVLDCGGFEGEGPAYLGGAVFDGGLDVHPEV